jgi:hypothetical protein
MTINPQTTTVIKVAPIVGAWSTKASFLSGWSGIDWGVWCFNQDSTVMMGSCLDTHGYGTWRQNADGSFAFSIIEQFFENQIWRMNINIYAPEVIVDHEGNSFSVSEDKPVQGTLYGTDGNFFGQATISLIGTRIQLGAASTLPRQGNA